MWCLRAASAEHRRLAAVRSTMRRPPRKPKRLVRKWRRTTAAAEAIALWPAPPKASEWTPVDSRCSMRSCRITLAAPQAPQAHPISAVWNEVSQRYRRLARAMVAMRQPRRRRSLRRASRAPRATEAPAAAGAAAAAAAATTTRAAAAKPSPQPLLGPLSRCLQSQQRALAAASAAAARRPPRPRALEGALAAARAPPRRLGRRRAQLRRGRR
mmetsp:Transcript_63375/g.205737  ORF Transcript_63375/g.205737 Transcript_63375/m.205737 type:complete len:213 (-) Transcript_63375:936-1574(-)